MTNVLIAFYSRGGATEALAKSIAAGATAAGGTVRLRRARELVGPEVMSQAPGWAENAQRMNALYEAPTADDAVWADAILFGSPTRFGSMTSELKAYIDGLGGLWAQGKLNGKAGGAFASTSTTHGGNEATVLSLYAPLAHLGLILVPTGYADAAMFAAGSPYGATAVVNGRDITAPSEAELAAASFQGRRTVEVAAALKAATKVARAA